MESGPRFMDSEEDYAALLGQSGWSQQERIDLTRRIPVFHAVRTRRGVRARADALAQVFGQDDVHQTRGAPTGRCRCHRCGTSCGASCSSRRQVELFLESMATPCGSEAGCDRRLPNCARPTGESTNRPAGDHISLPVGMVAKPHLRRRRAGAGARRRSPDCPNHSEHVGNTKGNVTEAPRGSEKKTLLRTSRRTTGGLLP